MYTELIGCLVCCQSHLSVRGRTKSNRKQGRATSPAVIGHATGIIFVHVMQLVLASLDLSAGVSLLSWFNVIVWAIA
jgi:hypothetical protein